MLQEQVYIIILLLMLIDGICVILGGYSALYLRTQMSDVTWTMETNIFIGSVFLVMLVNNYAMTKFRLYSDSRPPTYMSLYWSIVKAICVDFAVLSAAIFMFKQKFYSRAFLIYFGGLSLLYIVIARTIIQFYFDRLSKKGFSTKKILIVGDKQRSELVSRVMEKQLSWGHEIIGRLRVADDDALDDRVLGSIENLFQKLKTLAVDEVIFAVGKDQNIDLFSLVAQCRKMGVSTRILPASWEDEEECIAIEDCGGVPFITFKTNGFNATGLMYKRVLDIIGGIVGTFLFLIMYPFVTLAIKLDSPGPVLFKQKRMGKHGRIFNVYKFRTMYLDADKRREALMAGNEMNGAMFKIKDDPRITKVGRFLRRTSLDEFPQFFNVLIGEMSLVGTRPPMLEEVETYHEEHFKRLSTKPGITGLWQVSGRNKICNFDEVVALDCQYLEHWRFYDDLKILFKTIWVVLMRKGAS